MAAPSKAWVVIADSQIDADSPLDTTLVTALRDDVVHLEEWLGDGYTAAKDHDHDGTNSKLVVLASQTAGDYLLVENTTARTVTTTTYAKYKETKVGVGGTYRIKFSMKANTSGTIYGQIYRNGVAVGTERSTTSTTITEFSEDIGGWSSGDLVQLYSKRTVDGFVSIFNIYTAAPPIGGGLYNY